MKEAFVGFDSAWGGGRAGAMTWVIFEDNHLVSSALPRLVGFADAVQGIREIRGNCDDVLITIDQPIIVPNNFGVRPVDPVAHSLMDALHSIGQFANRRDGRNRSMFGDKAPVWQFAGTIGPQGYSGRTDNGDRRAFVDHQAATIPSKRAIHLIEVYPALSLPALQPTFMQHRKNGRRWAARYNPDRRRTFSLDDWRLVCETVVNYADRFHLQTLSDWAGEIGELAVPAKEHQDKVDAALCLIIALQWRRGREIDGMCVIGDLDTGYIVTPTSDDTRRILQEAVERRVPLDCR